MSHVNSIQKALIIFLIVQDDSDIRVYGLMNNCACSWKFSDKLNNYLDEYDCYYLGVYYGYGGRGGNSYFQVTEIRNKMPQIPVILQGEEDRRIDNWDISEFINVITNMSKSDLYNDICNLTDGIPTGNKNNYIGIYIKLINDYFKLIEDDKYADINYCHDNILK